MSTGILKIIFQKKNPKFESFIFWSKVHFLGTSLGLFSQFFFFCNFFCNFLSSVNHGDRHFYSAPHPQHEKASYGPVFSQFSFIVNTLCLEINNDKLEFFFLKRS